MDSKKKKRKLLAKLRDKYKLVILNEETFEEKFTLSLSRLNVFIASSVFLLIFTSLFVALVVYTPVKEYIPGYTDINLRRDLMYMTFKVDSLESVINSRDIYLENIRSIVRGDVDKLGEYHSDTAEFTKDEVHFDEEISEEEARLRKLIEIEGRFDLAHNASPQTRGISNYSFFSPLKGVVTEGFDRKVAHYGIDVVTKRDEAEKVTLDGTVVIASFTSETGYVIGVQHADNFFSLYKHNSILLKKVGNFVRAGEAIAIVGDSGELTSGPHLHFELWYNGNPVNPEDYIVF